MRYWQSGQRSGRRVFKRLMWPNILTSPWSCYLNRPFTSAQSRMLVGVAACSCSRLTWLDLRDLEGSGRSQVRVTQAFHDGVSHGGEPVS